MYMMLPNKLLSQSSDNIYISFDLPYIYQGDNMHIRIRKKNKDGIVRMESSGTIREVLINEDFLNPQKEAISLCFRGRDSSGIIDLAPEEVEHLYKSVKQKLHLIRGIKTLSD